MLLCGLVLVVVCDAVFGANITSHISLAQHWLHHEMSTDQLAHHFGVFDPKHVDPATFQIITINKKQSPSGNVAKRSDLSDEGDHTIYLKAFGNEFVVPLKRNFNLLSPYANVVDTSIDPVTGELRRKRMSVIEDDDEYPLYSCHYTHNSRAMGGALSNCGGDGDSYRGFLTDIDQVYEIYPADLHLEEKLKQVAKRDGHSEENKKYHIITKKSLAEFKLPLSDISESIQAMDKSAKTNAELLSKVGGDHNPKKRAGPTNLVVETAVFLDKSAYDIYVRFYDGDKQKIRNLLLAFVNGMQAIYHYPKLRKTIDFVIVRLELLQSEVFNNGGGERTKLLTSFCDYQGKNNPGDDKHPEHWDIGLLLSGQDFWAIENGVQSTITMGLATVTGICTKEYGCVIGEIGVRNQEGRPYPSTGFTSVYVMAHEIGHNLGMTHDHTAGCDKDGFIMSFSRGTKGETLWSTCSADVMDKLNLPCLEESSAPVKPEMDQGKYKNYPGLYWTSVEQCQFLLQDKRAKVNHDPSNMFEMCDRLLCRLDEAGTNGYFAAGPALEGTACRNDSGLNNADFCVKGVCTRRTDIQSLIAASANPTSSAGTSSSSGSTGTTAVVLPEWGPWRYGPCYTGCISKSRGALVRRRECKIPKPAVSATQCQGPTTEVQLCDNFATCDSSEISASEYANEMCSDYKNRLPSLKSSLTGEGKQPLYNAQRVQQACTIYCKTSTTGEWYSPQLELSQISGVDLFFPDGTWCNGDSKGDYYCRKNECLPSNPRAGRGDKTPDIPFLHNAQPAGGEIVIPEPVKEYFTLDKNDKPKNDDPHVFVENKPEEKEFEQSDDTISIKEMKTLMKP